ncbi:MAG: hypothetical protein IID44_28955 [Planctomycetes bacterium]|nr:hypothetical protein [Planctomycetota bacterium]
MKHPQVQRDLFILPKNRPRLVRTSAGNSSPRFFFVFLCAAIKCFAAGIGENGNWIVLILVFGAAMVTFVVLRQLRKDGSIVSWNLFCDRLESIPCRSQVTSIQWDDVERIAWSSKRVRIVAGKVVVVLFWHNFEAECRAEGREFIGRKLRKRFELPSESPSLVFQKTIIVLSVLAVVIGVVYYIGMRAKPESPISGVLPLATLNIVSGFAVFYYYWASGRLALRWLTPKRSKAPKTMTMV